MRRQRDEQVQSEVEVDDLVEVLSRRMAARLAEDLRRLARVVQRDAAAKKLKGAKRKTPKRRVTKAGPPFRLVGVH